MTSPIPVRPLVPGHAAARVLVLEEPLSLWGGVDQITGRITDPHHPQRGETISGMILVLPHGRGSSTTSSVLAEMIRIGTAPAGIVLSRADPIIVLGALVAAELYGRFVPIVVAEGDAFDVITHRAHAVLDADRARLGE